MRPSRRLTTAHTNRRKTLLPIYYIGYRVCARVGMSVQKKTAVNLHEIYVLVVCLKLRVSCDFREFKHDENSSPHLHSNNVSPECQEPGEKIPRQKYHVVRIS